MFVSVKKKEPLCIIVGNEENSNGISKMFEVDFPYDLAIPSKRPTQRMQKHLIWCSLQAYLQ